MDSITTVRPSAPPADPAPTLLRPLPDAVPAELRAIARWVCWKARPKANGKLDKLPCSPHTGSVGDAHDPAAWGSFEQAVIAMRRYRLDGIGIVLTGEDSLVGVDLDDCIDAAGGIAPWARDIIAELDSYTERSPSGCGLRLFAFGGLPPGRRKVGDLEMYDDARFLTVTGRHVEGTAATVEERDFELRDLHARHLGREAGEIGSAIVAPADVDEDEPPVRLDAAGLAAWRGERLVRKESGDVDRSRALYALACLLARAGATTRTITAALAERDGALGWHKYTDRRDGGQLEYRRIAGRAVAATTTAPVDPPDAQMEPPATIARLEAENRRLREELGALWERHRAFLQVLQNRSLTAGERQVALAVFIAVAAQQSHAEEPDGFVRVPLGTVAEQAGCSAQRASVHIGVLESAGVVEKRIDRRWVEVANRETGEITSRMQSEQYLRFVRPATEALQELTTLAPERPVTTEEQPRPKTWGGSRGGCPEHPNAGTVTRWTCACLACGSVLEQGERRDGQDDEGLPFQDERSAIVDGTDARSTEDGSGHVLNVRRGRADVHEPLHHGVPPVHTIGHHDARSGGGAGAGGDERTRRRDDDG
ncbi:MAG: hypothetical protein ACR2JY_04805 [Chloroflexota bacterium]